MSVCVFQGWFTYMFRGYPVLCVLGIHCVEYSVDVSFILTPKVPLLFTSLIDENLG